MELIIRRCLEKDPQARYADATELRRSLNSFRRQIGLPVEPTSDSDELASSPAGYLKPVAPIMRSRTTRLILLIGHVALLVGDRSYSLRQQAPHNLPSIQ